MRYIDIDMLILMKWSALIFVHQDWSIFHEPEYGDCTLLEHDIFNVTRFRDTRQFEEICLYLLLKEERVGL